MDDARAVAGGDMQTLTQPVAAHGSLERIGGVKISDKTSEAHHSKADASVIAEIIFCLIYGRPF